MGKKSNRKINFEAKSLCEFTIAVSHEVDKLLTIELLSESSLHEWVVDTHSDDFISSTGFDLGSVLDVAWEMFKLAGSCE